MTCLVCIYIIKAINKKRLIVIQVDGYQLNHLVRGNSEEDVAELKNLCVQQRAQSIRHTFLSAMAGTACMTAGIIGTATATIWGNRLLSLPSIAGIGCGILMFAGAARTWERVEKLESIEKLLNNSREFLNCANHYGIQLNSRDQSGLTTERLLAVYDAVSKSNEVVQALRQIAQSSPLELPPAYE